jgi:hypothetical protein
LAIDRDSPYHFGMGKSISTAKPAIGSWDWLVQTGGNLSAAERFSLVPGLTRTFAEFTVDRVKLALGAVPRHSFGTEDLWRVAPDSQLSRHALEEARDLQSLPVLNHGYRTWVFGSALATIDGADVDPELFHAASLLHDVGLEHIEPNVCFTRRSAEAAHAAAERASSDQGRALDMMTGIGSHITPGLRYEASPLGFYIQAGAMADLAGLRAWELPSALRERASQAYPREGVHQVLARCWHTEAKAVPRGRAHFADRWGAFSRILRWFPVRG